MKTMAISEFKTHALKVLNEVAKSQETIVITKRGKPLAQVVPYRKSPQVPNIRSNDSDWYRLKNERR